MEEMYLYESQIEAYEVALQQNGFTPEQSKAMLTVVVDMFNWFMKGHSEL